MKKTLSLFGLLLGSGFTSAQITAPSSGISTGENYVFSRTYLDAATTSNTTTKQQQSVTYFDGLGRPKQSIAIKASPTGNDVVSHIEYDPFGRQVKDYLPVPQSGTLNGGLFPNPLSNAANPNIYGTEKIYAEKILENSPLDRINAKMNPGAAWANKPITFGYQTNSSQEVYQFTTSTSWVNNATKSTLTFGFYPPNQLYKNVVTDEDLNTTVEFKNVEGQTVLVRKNDGTQNIDTYYVYNEFNQLAFVIPPNAVHHPITDPLLNDLCYQYRYDGRGRLVEKKLPGKGWEFMVYDKADRLILTQDALLQQQGKWLITKYDQFGRVAYTGMIGGGDRLSMQNQITNLVITEIRSATGFPLSGTTIYYTNGYFTSIDTVLSVNYYDSYPTGTLFPSSNEILGAPILLDDLTANRSTKSLPTASFVKNIENNGWTKNYTFYDGKARPIGTYSYNHLGGFTKTESKLDFAGIPQKTFTYHKRRVADEEIQVKERFVYNQFNNALEKHYHEVVGKSPEELLTDNHYNELGQLNNKKVGNNIQEIDYSYNIRGWLTGINLDSSDNPQAGKLFNYKIKYNNPDPITATVVGKYNGNIAEIDWWNNGSSTKRYSYQYDGLNRLLNGIYNDPGATIPTYINSESIEYDVNGNITHLYRNAKHPFSYTPIQIDNLTYTYENTNKSNRLSTIDDNLGGTANPSGYEGGGNPITYDFNGNMTSMTDKGISAITYNFLNLPTQINQNTNTTKYIYRADGVKLKKEYTLVNTTTKVINTEYLDGFQYSTPNIEPIRRALEEQDDATVSASTAGEEEAFFPLEDRALAVIGPGNPPQAENMILSFFPTSEGLYDYENFRYIYQYKDHLGNVRVSFVKDSKDDIQVMDTNEYYPFGMSFIKGNAFGGSVYDPMAIPYNYKYNGKELQETGMYDYGARMYMPDIARWGVSDGKGELYLSKSPYSYANNTPINAIDPDGNLVIFINGMHFGDGGSSKYWTSSTVLGRMQVAGGAWMPMYKRFDMSVMHQLNDYNSLYRDGSSGGALNTLFADGNFYKSNLSAQNRIDNGYKQGKKDAKEIIANLERDSTTGEIIETIKIITHSMGGAYGKGYVNALMDYAKKNGLENQVRVTLVADFDPFQAGDLTVNPKAHTLQFTNKDGKGRKDSDGLGGLANEIENGLPIDNYTENNSDAAHSIMTFFSNISQLQEGTYTWNGASWICSSCNDKATH